MKLRGALLAATVLAAVPAAAWAQPVDGLYVGGGAGASWLQQETLKSVTRGTGQTFPVGSSNNGKIDFNNPGFVGLASIGYGLGNGLRVELEGSYRQNDVHKATAFNRSFTATGKEKKYGPMVNVLYDFPISDLFTPYVGIGAGYQFMNWDGVTLSNTGSFYHSSDTRGGFAFQPILGAAFPIAAIPGLAVTLEYRFMDVIGNHGFKATLTQPASGAGPAVVNTTDNYNHSVLIGLRYAFGVAPAAAPPMVPPVTVPLARSYLVFFDWDKATLTDRARQIIAEAATAIPKVQHTQIEVNGYTDTSGTPKYNQGLSIRRANAVAAELVRLGVAKSEIAIQGFGETHLLVPTAAGVREPQNRRVEIIIK